jgi:DNA polymerase III subunit epsilon
MEADMTWATQPMTGFALATTGVDPSTARIVAISRRTVNDGINAPAATLMVNTPQTIPAAATKFHGITNEMTATGFSPFAAVTSLVASIMDAAANGHAVVIFNSEWFFQVLGNEARADGVAFEIPSDLHIVDPLILDGHLNPTRRSGNRTLPALGASWCVPMATGASDENVNAAMRLAWRIGTTHPAVRNMTLTELFAAQRTWKSEADTDRVAYRDSRSREFVSAVA